MITVHKRHHVHMEEGRFYHTFLYFSERRIVKVAKRTKNKLQTGD